jgi:hypothetical protein
VKTSNLTVNLIVVFPIWGRSNILMNVAMGKHCVVDNGNFTPAKIYYANFIAIINFM